VTSTPPGRHRGLGTIQHAPTPPSMSSKKSRKKTDAPIAAPPAIRRLARELGIDLARVSAGRNAADASA
jgi:pyruvate/2-oxoglutarate dehydrogenase complex dihydrolipoamide acyltransferase (E2) component